MILRASAAGGGSRLGDHASRLSADHHCRHVVRHGVVQLARQLLAFPQSDLVQLASSRDCPEADQGAEKCGEHEEHEARCRFAEAVEIARDPEQAADHDDRQPDHDFATRPPSKQCVGDQQHIDHRVQPHGCGGTIDQRDEVQHDECAEEHRGDSEWVRPPPQKREHQRHGEHERRRTPRGIRTKDAFENGGRHQDSDQCPVPPHARRRLRSPRFVPQGQDRVSHHGSSVGIARGRCIGRKNQACPGPSAGTTQASTADVPHGVTGHDRGRRQLG